jgi:hypothetical protein
LAHNARSLPASYFGGFASIAMYANPAIGSIIPVSVSGLAMALTISLERLPKINCSTNAANCPFDRQDGTGWTLSMNIFAVHAAYSAGAQLGKQRQACLGSSLTSASRRLL